MEQENYKVESTKWVIPFIAVLAGQAMLQAGSLGFTPLLPAIQKEFAMNFSQFGLFTGLYGLAAIICSVPAGMLVKRFGEKSIYVIGLVIVAIGLFLLSSAHGFALALAGRAIWLAGYRFAFVAMLAAVALTCPPRLRGSSMGIVGAVSSIAIVVGAPFGSLLSRDGWRFGIWGFAALAVIGAAAVFFFYKAMFTADPAANRHGSSADGPPVGAVSAFKSPLVWALTLLLGLAGISSLTTSFFFPSAAKGIFHLPALTIAYNVGAGYFVAIFANLFLGYLMDKYNKWVVMAGIMLVQIPFALMMTTSNVIAFRVGAILLVAVGFCASNQVYGLAADALRGSETGNVMGIVCLGAGVYGYLAPQVLGFLRDWTGGFNAGWYFLCVLCAAAAIEIALLSRYVKHKNPVASLAAQTAPVGKA